MVDHAVQDMLQVDEETSNLTALALSKQRRKTDPRSKQPPLINETKNYPDVTPNVSVLTPKDDVMSTDLH